MIKIDKNNPMPPKRKTVYIVRPPVYPTAELEVGESFDVPLNRRRRASYRYSKAYAAASAMTRYAAKKLGRKLGHTIAPRGIEMLADDAKRRASRSGA